MHLTDHLTEVQLNEYLDGEGVNRAQVELHLSSCADCAAQLTSLQILLAELDSLPDVDLSRDISAAVTGRLGSPGTAFSSIPRWLTLTAALQTAAALATIILAAPFVIDATLSSLPVLQTPSLNDLLFEVQMQWITWLDMLSQLQMPSLPQLPLALDMSGLYFMLILAGTSALWLVGNGILLRNQIK